MATELAVNTWSITSGVLASFGFVVHQTVVAVLRIKPKIGLVTATGAMVGDHVALRAEEHIFAIDSRMIPCRTFLALWWCGHVEDLVPKEVFRC